MIKVYTTILYCAAIFIFAGCSAGEYKGDYTNTPPYETPGESDTGSGRQLTEVLYNGGDSYSSLYRISYDEGTVASVIKSSFCDLTKFPEDNYDEMLKAGYTVTNFRYNQQNVLFDIIYTSPELYSEYYDISLDGSFKAVKMSVVSSLGETWNADFFYLENGYLQSVKCRQEYPDANENMVTLRECSLVYTYNREAVQTMVYTVKDNDGKVTETIYSFYGLDFPNKGGIMHPDLDNGFYAMGPLMYGGMIGKIPEKLHNKCIYETVIDGVPEKINLTSSYEYDQYGYITEITRTTEYGEIYPDAALRSASAKSVGKYLYKYDDRD